jgi:phosphoribosylanthranilate isomerase
MTRVKICGCMRVEDAVAAAEAGADFIGIMFASASRRRVPVEEAAQIAAAVGGPLAEIEQETPPPHAAAGEMAVSRWFERGAAALDRLLARKRPLVVGVFEDQPIEDVNETADEVGLDLVQFSGNETLSDCLLANRLVVKVVRAPELRGNYSAEVLIEPQGAIAAMLDDSRGRGIPGDRTLASKVAGQMPIWLAGGLSPEIVADVVRTVRPWCVDVSSGVETAGAKDPAKIAAFIRAVREAE